MEVSTPPSAAAHGFVRLDIDGDASVTTEYGKDLVIQPDGKIIVVGNYQPGIIEGNTNPRNALIARFNSDGSPDSTFASGGFKIGRSPIGHSFLTTDVALQSNGNIIVAGSDSDGTNSHPLLMRFFGGSPLMAAGGAAHAVSDAKSLKWHRSSRCCTKPWPAGK